MAFTTEQKTHLLDDSHSDLNSDSRFELSRETHPDNTYHDARTSLSNNLRLSLLIHAFLIIGYTIVSGAVIWHMKKKYRAGPGLVYCTPYFLFLLVVKLKLMTAQSSSKTEYQL